MKRYLKKSTANLLATDGEWNLYQPLTYEALVTMAQLGGEYAKWNLSGESYWNNAISHHSLYIFINTANPRQKYISCPYYSRWLRNFYGKDLGLEGLLKFLHKHEPFAEALDLHEDNLQRFYVHDSKLFTYNDVLMLGDVSLETTKHSVVESYSEDSDVVLDDGVDLGSHAFEGNQNLKHVTLPEGLERIGSDAFYNCSNLISVNIPNSVRYIGPLAFSHTALQHVTLPNNVRLGEEVFVESNLVEIEIPKGVNVSFMCFDDCIRLKTVRLPEGLTELDMRAFSGCTSLRNIELPSSLREIGEKCFRDCTSLTKLVIPDSVVDIGAEAFERCKNLTIFIHTDDFDELLEDCGVKEIVHDF